MSTIKDIAKRANVSVATVSYVLNNTRFVSPEKKKRVEEAIKELNYVPNAVARGLRVKNSKVISLVVSDITNPFYPDIAKACEQVAYQSGYTLNIVNTNDQDDRFIKAVMQLREGKVDGIINTTVLDHHRSLMENLIKDKYPIVLAHRLLDGINMDTVVADNIQAAIDATNHLINLGHKKIAFMTGVTKSSINNLRIKGFLKAMKDANLPTKEDWLASGQAKYQQSYDLTKELLKNSNNRPTAIINISDLGALGVLDAAGDLGIMVPEELAVVGFDDLFISSMRSVQLTTIRIPRYEIGQKSMELLIDKITNNDTNNHHNILLPAELIVRKTCGSRIID
ncbi:LacI family DNA-binding transcriptional regulator [Peribacillus huizhouensis]|uniref:DNA-binding LacI/PurR family transcriptional regulator n=1 Tax=Peribacillus huizhouensis TaxID=1501239 RepID=A0ABR6CU35_9BACI|nr:LacI family DNA-binding transcriptional regulator [Peribacillus huizhouensis]MBA9028546.1 DNA-binding LacI/PurR family transcriptional regulator [Peribacillus huizhouensis]